MLWKVWELINSVLVLLSLPFLSGDLNSPCTLSSFFVFILGFAAFRLQLYIVLNVIFGISAVFFFDFLTFFIHQCIFFQYPLNSSFVPQYSSKISNVLIHCFLNCFFSPLAFPPNYIFTYFWFIIMIFNFVPTISFTSTHLLSFWPSKEQLERFWFST